MGHIFEENGTKWDKNGAKEGNFCENGVKKWGIFLKVGHLLGKVGHIFSYRASGAVPVAVGFVLQDREQTVHVIGVRAVIAAQNVPA